MLTDDLLQDPRFRQALARLVDAMRRTGVVDLAELRAFFASLPRAPTPDASRAPPTAHNAPLRDRYLEQVRLLRNNETTPRPPGDRGFAFERLFARDAQVIAHVNIFLQNMERRLLSSSNP